MNAILAKLGEKLAEWAARRAWARLHRRKRRKHPPAKARGECGAHCPCRVEL